MEKGLIFAVCLSTLYGFAIPAPYDEVEGDGEILYDPLSPKSFMMPANCKQKKMEFCFENADYPSDIIAELLQDIPNLEVSNDEDSELFNRISHRQGTSDQNDCQAQSSDAPIHYIVDKLGRDRVVVQLPGKFEQRYSVMWCDQEGRITSRTEHFLQKTVTDNEMSCENKHMHYDFLVLSLKPDLKGKWRMERAQTKSGIPVCCSCKYVKKM